MSCREFEGYKGPVRHVTLERSFATIRRFEWLFDPRGELVKVGCQSSDGTELAMEYRYNQRGELIHPPPPVKIIGEAGSWDEVEDLSDLERLVWPGSKPQPFSDKLASNLSERFYYRSTVSKVIRPPLRKIGIGFASHGASRVVTSFDRHGVPVQITFFKKRDEVVSRVLLRSDERGNIVEVAICSGVTPFLDLRWYERLFMGSSQRRSLAPLLEPYGVVSRTIVKYDFAGSGH